MDRLYGKVWGRKVGERFPCCSDKAINIAQELLMYLKLVNNDGQHRMIEVDDYEVDTRVMPYNMQVGDKIMGWPQEPDYEMFLQEPAPMIQAEGKTGFPVYRRLHFKREERYVTILFQSDLYVMNSRGDTIDKIPGLRPGSWWKLKLRNGCDPCWFEITDECDNCHQPLQTSEQRGTLNTVGITSSSRLCDKCCPPKPDYRRISMEVVAEALGAEPVPAKPVPRRMWVRIKGTNLGIAIDTDPKRSYEHNRIMAMEAVSRELRNKRLDAVVHLMEGCEVVGEVIIEQEAEEALARKAARQKAMEIREFGH